jgi:hypothetical protein
MTVFRKTLALIFIAVGSFISGYSQPGSGPNDGTKPGTVPISGIEILIVIGSLFGVKKIVDSKKRR